MSKVTAIYSLAGGTTDEFEIDVTGMTPGEIAEQLHNEGAPLSVCHQCADVIDDPAVGTLIGFSVDGQSYSYDPVRTWIKDD